MAALMIINYDVTDREKLDDYRIKAKPLLIGPALGEAVAISDGTVDLNEGTAAGSDTVVLRYPSVAAAQAAYDAKDYQEILGLRLDATVPKIAMIVETMD